MSENQSRRRVTFTQLLHLWEFLNNHREIATGYNKSAQARDHSKRMWEQAASILNSTGDGAVKTGPEWSKYWVDYKSKLKRKNSLINISSRRTGGGPSSDMELSEIERQFLIILGEDYGRGLPGIQVNPFPTQDLAESDNTTIQSSADENPLYLNVNFSENENLQDTEENLSSISLLPQAPSQQSPQQHSESSSTQVNQATDTPQQLEANPSASTSQGQANTRASGTPQPPQQQQAQRPTPRRRRRSRRRLTAADAREQLVAAAQERAQAELANSRSIRQAVGILGNMVTILERIESRLSGGDPTTD